MSIARGILLGVDAPALIQRWWTYHLVRSAALGLGLLALITATLLRNRG